MPADAWVPARAGCLHVRAEGVGSKSLVPGHSRPGYLAKPIAFSMSCCPQRSQRVLLLADSLYRFGVTNRLLMGSHLQLQAEWKPGQVADWIKPFLQGLQMGGDWLSRWQKDA